MQAMRAREQQMQQMQTVPEKMHGMFKIFQADDIKIEFFQVFH